MPTVVLPKIAVVKPDQEQAQTPCRQHGVDHAAVEKANDRSFDDDADKRRPRPAPTTSIAIQMLMPAGRDDRGIAAEHQELAMREIDDPHHAEDDRQPDADQRQAGDRVKDLD